MHQNRLLFFDIHFQMALLKMYLQIGIVGKCQRTFAALQIHDFFRVNAQMTPVIIFPTERHLALATNELKKVKN